ncbi:hypothetical protein O3P69_019297 [Scylla paramamosain]|uniref:tRNA-uridine aminocarboxypropyltransferase n=1 Tax=Scylla paramamosain TaxID=85552 RepID=A0AAW0SX38_SCYPA
MEELEEEISLLGQLVDIEIGRREKRPLCSRCRRPRGVCWCEGLGGAMVTIKSHILVLQHPHEEKRCLRTAPILTACLDPSHYKLMRGKRFPHSRYPELQPILSSPATILMYPGEEAVGVERLPKVGEGGQGPYNIVILDGTWQQAKGIYFNCPGLHSLPQVCLSGRYTSEYIIRTQPTQDALSTVETAALTLAILEENWALYDQLVEPLRVLCRHQIQHGAVPHKSKEEMILSGRCQKPLGKRTYKKLRKCGARHSDALAASMLVTGDAPRPDNTTNTHAITSKGVGVDGIENIRLVVSASEGSGGGGLGSGEEESIVGDVGF